MLSDCSNHEISKFQEYVNDLPSISIVVPNFNGGRTLARTLQSLVDQKYPKLQIVVVDGGSTDNSLDIIRSFEEHISWWVSEKDNGQSNAINKGFNHCSGEIVNWLCSDDVLTLGALLFVGKKFLENPAIDVLAGSARIVHTHQNNKVHIVRPTLERIELMPAGHAIAQPSCFFKRRLLNRSEPLDESYFYTMDLELWNYFKSCNVKWACTTQELSIAFQDDNNKSNTGGEKVTFEIERVYKTYVRELIPLTFWHRHLRYPLEKFLAHHPSKKWLFVVGPIWLAIGLLLAPFYGLRRTWVMRWKRWA